MKTETYIVCKGCGKKIRKSLSYCPECGAEYIPQKIRTRQKGLRSTVIAISAIFLILFIVFPEVRELAMNTAFIITLIVFMVVAIFVIVIFSVIFGSNGGRWS